MPDPSFSFSEPDGVIADSTGRTWKLCPHLVPLLTALLRQPTMIRSVTEAWSRTDLSVTVGRGPSLDRIDALGPLPPEVASWSNDDTHYDLEFGLACTACRHTLSWPRR